MNILCILSLSASLRVVVFCLWLHRHAWSFLGALRSFASLRDGSFGVVTTLCCALSVDRNAPNGEDERITIRPAECRRTILQEKP
jgi:hypothetical protein